jgi:hypothetical protein
VLAFALIITSCSDSYCAVGPTITVSGGSHTSSSSHQHHTPWHDGVLLSTGSLRQ